MMEICDYVQLMDNVKTKLSDENSTFSSKVLDECKQYTSMVFETIKDSLACPDVDVSQLNTYLEETTTFIRLLSNTIKNCTEPNSKSSSYSETFPQAIGHIIMTVFSHCKDSISAYGKHLNYVEGQLKNLFKTCHELQAIYLLVLEHHYCFDVKEKNQLDGLLDFFDINLKIAEIAQHIGTKTMADQLKSCLSMSEKYAEALSYTSIYDDCSRMLCKITFNNLKKAVEINHDEKQMLNSLKVACFTLKLLSKLLTIFQHVTQKNYQNLIDLIIHIYSTNQLQKENKPGMENALHVYILTPANDILTKLLTDVSFMKKISHTEMKTMSEDELLGLTLLLIDICQAFLKAPAECDFGEDLIYCIFKILPHGHVWFNTNMTYFIGCDKNVGFGLYDYLLLHTYSVISNLEDVEILERHMFEAILSCEVYTAMFALDLWVLVARVCDQKLLYHQILFIIEWCEKFRDKHIILHSPQIESIKNLLIRLHSELSTENKMQILTELEKFDLSSVTDIDFVTKFTWQQSKTNLPSKDDVIENWERACPCRLHMTEKEEICASATYYNYVKLLIKFSSIQEQSLFRDSYQNWNKCLHVIYNIVITGNVHLQLEVIPLLCKLLLYKTRDKNESLLVNTFNNLLGSDNCLVRCKLISELNLYSPYKYLEDVLSKVLNSNRREEHDNFLKNLVTKQQLSVYSKSTFTHLCIPKFDKSNICIRVENKYKEDNNENNCDTKKKLRQFAFEKNCSVNNEGCESPGKKPKLMQKETENLISTLEEVTTKLQNNAVAIDEANKKKILNVCNSLQDMIS